jgi:hypothetical protein
MAKARLRPVIVTDETGRPAAVQVDLASFHHVLELLAALLRDGRVPAGMSADDPLLVQLADLLGGNGDSTDPRERLEDLLDSVTLLCAKAEPADYVDYEDVRAELLKPDKP